ncbi:MULTISPECIES: SDR family oxidoreductase [unclassified Pseudoalteromonas]|uniref:SDR family oxidoreductase n=1 Tax=unclassified Pseudoalteromonas TaxID=194690 RepID=UPI001F322740|nr:MULTISPECIES: SDR family oxidoreductase [unclassified Pseudoalteromonas]MCF2826030.1 SDR family oxidoreductase [Pseudoalteromonas sp. OF5H-5]MCF2831685.1 SDR family oxidoreductase [Pseudoalteromonas sp. DL2-H6]MCF2925021.1 SDR family oxidoreductase [Pseudoalteromonas sp. DL2-H1]
MIAITGATGKLGQLVIEFLAQKIPTKHIVALVRDLDKGKALANLGVTVRQADYDKPHTLDAALTGVEKLLLISGNQIGSRTAQHKAVIDAAVKNQVRLIAYTSILNVDNSPLELAKEHKETEAYLRASGVAYSMLRNGWYNENYTDLVPVFTANHAITSIAPQAQINSAARADYALAAATILSSAGHDNSVYELAGDHAFTIAGLAQAVSKHTQVEVKAKFVSDEEYLAHLVALGVPAAFAALLVDAEAQAQQGYLATQSNALSQLIGRPTTTVAQSLAKN